MNYHVELSAAVGTTAAAPATAELKLTPGMIEHAHVYFPPSSGGWCNAQIWLNGYQLIPWERGTWLRGDDVLYPDLGRYPVDQEPYLVTVKAFNTGTLYPHVVLVSVELTPYQAAPSQSQDMSLIGMRFD